MSTGSDNEVKTLKELLEERAVNKTKLAKRMGVGRTTLFNWENGIQNITLEHAVKLAAELNVSLKQLSGSFGYDTSRVPPDRIEPTSPQATDPTKSGGEAN